MLSAIRDFFTDNFAGDSVDNRPELSFQLAAAALMLEIANSDDNFSTEEQQSLEQQLRELYPELNQDALQQLRIEAEKEQQEATSLFEFTRHINDHFTYSDKCRLLTALWRIARADGKIDKFEAHMIRRVADLLHITHHDYVMAKQHSVEANDKD